ncbi:MULTISPECIES: LacI family DNA-binding transcriptional regulator [Sphingobacterium]|uniref:LacI family DNA-binding transcriptional regulator n=1 Tax=Sphingobacterium TaxID=28453 RepID=UPI0013D90911|nr:MULTISPECIES: LacI family DNA-binding transcriptional regulator [unclassified Sphingobacterium]
MNKKLVQKKEIGQKVTLVDIAKANNCSVSTVSRALSDSHEIGEKTKKRIVEYANKHNYIFNNLAKTLKRGKSNLIGVVVGNSGNSFFSALLEGIHQGARESSYSIIVMQSNDNPGEEKKCITTLVSIGVDALIISPIGNSDNIEYLQKLHINRCMVIAVDRINNRLQTIKIGSKNYEGAYLATKQLIEMGRDRIAHITLNAKGVSQERFNGFKECLKNHNIKINDKYIQKIQVNNNDELYAELEKCISTLWKIRSRPNAIFCAMDNITNNIYDILRDKKISVPKDVIIAGFSNMEYLSNFKNPIIRIEQNAFDIGKEAIQTAFEYLNNQGLPLSKRIEFNVKLIQ